MTRDEIGVARQLALHAHAVLVFCRLRALWPPHADRKSADEVLEGAALAGPRLSASSPVRVCPRRRESLAPAAAPAGAVLLRAHPVSSLRCMGCTKVENRNR